MITADKVLPIWMEHREALSHPVRSFSFPEFNRTFDDRPYQMGVINFSKQSSYRESICYTVEGALYRARRMTLEGCAIIDVGAESTQNTADLIDISLQIDQLVPVAKALSDEGILVSVETYHPEVAEAVLKAGARVINLTGRIDDPGFYELIARYEAGVILCYTPGQNARSADGLPSYDMLIAEQLDFFRARLELATSAGVERIWIDQGFGFGLNLSAGPDLIRYQTQGLLQAFRFRVLGWPVCVSMIGSLYLFKDEVRCGETWSATLALFSKANLMRSHEGARVQPVIDLFDIFEGA